MIRSQRLHLSPVHEANAEDIRRLAGDAKIARDALDIPHPFEEGMAEAWIGSLKSSDAVFAVRRQPDESLIGLVGLIPDSNSMKAELSYWIGHEYQGRGYATEAVEAVVVYGFGTMGLHRIYATSLARNSASGRVLEKSGFSVEGCLRQHVVHWGVCEDLLYHGLLREDYRE